MKRENAQWSVHGLKVQKNEKERLCTAEPLRFICPENSGQCATLSFAEWSTRLCTQERPASKSGEMLSGGA